MTDSFDNITTLKKSANSNSDFLYLLNKLDLKSSLARFYLYSLKFTKNKTELQNEFDKIEETISLFENKKNSKIFSDIENKLSQILDINGTLQNLKNSIILSDIELFEIKKFAILADDIRQIIVEFELIDLPDLSEVINILDPEKNRITSFYIYDAYSTELAALRKLISTNEQKSSAETYQKIVEIEDDIRKKLSVKLQYHTTYLSVALHKIAYFDLLIAKSKQAKEYGFCKPVIVENSMSYKGLFNPQLKDVLNSENKKYQPVDISFGKYPTLITGINMGGKTVLLKTLALAQNLCQYGFYVPATNAEICLFDKIMISIDDEQNHLQGLSSFAAEMKNLNEILLKIAEKKSLLVLFDELARTTNPSESRAIVTALLDTLSENNVCSFITTHYDKIISDCRRLRVRGFAENVKIENEKNIQQYIDYSLVEESKTNVPHEAIRIAEMLGVDKNFIEKAKEKLLMQ
jgi:dsDNA-specific endonuclease/ATPase MutS2